MKSPPGTPLTQCAPRTQGAFSLTELLVAVALLAALLALTLPAFSSLKAKGETTRCLSNLRATGAAAIAYFTDRDGLFFTSKYWEVYPSTRPPSTQGMRDYLGVESNLKSIADVAAYQHDSIITCPTMQRLYPHLRMTLHRTYSYNYYLNYKNPHSKYRGTPYDEIPLLPGGYWKLQNVPHPAGMWMFTEGNAEGTTYPTSIQESMVGTLPFPHEQRQHVVFLDGHVESLSREAFRERAETPSFWGKHP